MIRNKTSSTYFVSLGLFVSFGLFATELWSAVVSVTVFGEIVLLWYKISIYLRQYLAKCRNYSGNFCYDVWQIFIVVNGQN